MHNDVYEIRQMPLSVKFVRQQVETFLALNGLRLGPMDYYAAVFEHGGEDILAGGGLSGNVIKCIAVKQGLRDAKLSLTIISHLISTASSYGIHQLKIFTKPENEKMFESLGFQTIAKSEHAILQENDNSLLLFKKRLASLRQDFPSGIIILNANPFTKGHRYLIEQASKKVNHLIVMVVEEDLSRFSYAERRAMVEAGCQDLPRVTVCSTDSYAVSAATFPTYFLKELDKATDTQIMLDLDLFVRHIAPTLNIQTRFIGSEPSDPLTQRYNELMKEYLPTQGIAVEEVPRLHQDHVHVSASSLRGYLKAHSLQQASALAFPTTIPYLIADLACQALQEELDLTPKPGLVDQHDNGAHRDMDYQLMQKSIHALRPYFDELALLGWKKDKPYVYDVQTIGLRAENTMFTTTKGVNTHKGALFSLGLAIVAGAYLMRQKGKVEAVELQQTMMEIARQFPETSGTHGSEVAEKYHIDGVLAIARKGYPDLFEKWLPFLQNEEGKMKDEESTNAIDSQSNKPSIFHLQSVLLYIMSMLDDTNVYYRKGEKGAWQVKREAARILDNFSMGELEAMNKRFIAANISPGGSADMLALTRLVQSLIE
ncbi:MAG: [Prevotella sp.]|nr:[citrate (pro-3S)-lyase] ligase [Prevotella sp.]